MYIFVCFLHKIDVATERKWGGEGEVGEERERERESGIGDLTNPNKANTEHTLFLATLKGQLNEILFFYDEYEC